MTEKKTNAMRILDRQKAEYQVNYYQCEHFEDGVQVAKQCGIPPEECFKTLVAFHKEKTGKTEYFVFVIPVAEKLALKAAAECVGVKSVEMLAMKELVAVTGYIRGGCSPVGMKKQFQTVIDSSAEKFEKIYVSAGRPGAQLRISPQVLAQAAKAKFAEITEASGTEFPYGKDRLKNGSDG